jgi:hypothetical protein
MLETLLDRISKGRSSSIQSMAQEFGVSQELMELMLSDLTRANYLRRVEGCDESECDKCLLVSTCKPRGKVWKLVRKGSAE